MAPENPYVFPFDERRYYGEDIEQQHYGMTLRDKAAIAAMQAQLSNSDRLKQLAEAAKIAQGNPDHREEQVFTWIADASYKAADAMLKAREK